MFIKINTHTLKDSGMTLKYNKEHGTIDLSDGEGKGTFIGIIREDGEVCLSGPLTDKLLETYCTITEE